MLIMFPLACRLGLKAEACATICALTVHETAHLAAAAAAGVPIPELRLMPFGGSASIGNPYAIAPWQLFIVASAGPLSNLFLILSSAALCHWGIMDYSLAALFTRVNLLLMLFNILPALPLDGGRMLYALLFRRFGAERSLAIGLWTGRILALLLLSGAILLFIFKGIFNLSYIFAAVFLLSSGPKERAALSVSNFRSIMTALTPVISPVPVNMTAVDITCPARIALRSSRPGSVNLYAVYAGGVLIGFSDEKTLAKLCINADTSATVSEARICKLHRA